MSLNEWARTCCGFWFFCRSEVMLTWLVNKLMRGTVDVKGWHCGQMAAHHLWPTGCECHSLFLNSCARIFNKQAQGLHLIKKMPHRLIFSQDFFFFFLHHRDVPNVKASLWIYCTVYMKSLLSSSFSNSHKGTLVYSSSTLDLTERKSKNVPYASSVSFCHLILYPKYFHVWDPASIKKKKI